MLSNLSRDLPDAAETLLAVGYENLCIRDSCAFALSCFILSEELEESGGVSSGSAGGVHCGGGKPKSKRLLSTGKVGQISTDARPPYLG